MKINIQGIEPQFKVYKMTESVTDKVYIGSTSLSLKQRMCAHKNGVNTTDKYFALIGWDYITVEIIDVATNVVDMKIKENEHIIRLKHISPQQLLNKNIAYTGMNRNEYAKHHYENNKEYYKKLFTSKMRCDVCDAEFQKSGISHHNKTKKHTEKIKNNDIDIKLRLL